MGLMAEVTGVFSFLHESFLVLPTAIRLLVLAAFGGTVYIAVMNNFKG